VRAKSPEADTRTRAALDETMKRMEAIVQRANGGEAYDQMLGEGNAEGSALIEGAIQALIAQAKEFERDIAALELNSIEFEGSDSLDNPGSVR
jgi:putative iron-regulated protein